MTHPTGPAAVRFLWRLTALLLAVAVVVVGVGLVGWAWRGRWGYRESGGVDGY